MTIYDPGAMGRPLLIPEAIAKQEGWNASPTSRCRRNMNPGNLNFEPWEEEFGGVLETVTAGEARFAVFPSSIQGFAALVHLCGFPKYKGGTLANLIEAWAPPQDGNDTSAYLANVISWTGLTADTIIDAYLGV